MIMEPFTATLVRNPSLLRELRHRLSAWLEQSNASNEDHDSIVLATHEAAAHAMENGEEGGTIEITASREGDQSFLVHVRNEGSWVAITGDAPQNAGRLTDLMTEVSRRTSSTVRLLREKPLSAA